MIYDQENYYDLEQIIESGKEDEEHLVIRINDQKAEASIVGNHEPILSFAAFVKDPDGGCSVYNTENFFFAGDFKFKKADWKCFLRLDSRCYKLSVKTPYKSDYSMFFFIKTYNYIIIMALASPVFYDAPLSGVFIDIGAAGVNYNRVLEMSSIFIRFISDKAMCEKLEAERDNVASNKLVDMDMSEISDESYDNYSYGDYNGDEYYYSDEEGNDYE